MNTVFIADAFEKMRNWIQGWGGALLSILPKTLYFLCTLIFQVIDILQILVRKVAGLDVVYYGSESTPQTGDIALKFIEEIFTGKNSILSNIFWAFIILGLILLFITTFVAVLRSEYAGTDSKSASKGKIIGKAFKAIASFAIVPIVCFFGMFIANVILQALDSITAQTSNEISYSYSETSESGELQTASVSNLFESLTTTKDEQTYISYNFWGSGSDSHVATSSTPISGLIFKASAYKANRIRSNGIIKEHLGEDNVGAGVFGKFGTDYDKASNLLDECFANGYKLKSEVELTTEPFKESYLFPLGSSGSSFFTNEGQSFQTFDKNNTSLVWYYYDLWSFDFIIAIASLVVVAKLLIYIVFGLMKRLFELVILFLIAPPLASLMPLDEGSALKKWREKFTAKVISAYGPVVGLNLFFVILPFLTQIKFFNIPFVDGIVNAFFVIVGLLMVKDLIGTISEFIGAEDSAKSGEGMAGDVGGTLAKVGKLAAAPAGLAIRGVKTGIKFGKKATDKIKTGHEKRMLNNSIIKEHGGEMTDMSRRQRKRFLASERSKLSEEQKHDILTSSSARTKFSNWATKNPDNVFSKMITRKQRKYGENNLGFELYKKKNPGKTGKNWLSISAGEREKYISQARMMASNVGVDQRRDELLKAQKAYKRNQAKVLKLEGKFSDQKAKVEIARQKYNMAKPGKQKARALDEFNKADLKAGQIGVKMLNEKYVTGSALEKNVNKAKSNLQNAETKRDETRQKIAQYGAQTMQSVANGKGILKGEKQSVSQLGLDLAKSFIDNLSPILNTLGDKMAKGFKDSGGWEQIGNRAMGYSGKEEKVAKAVKEQKLNMSAQREAQKLIGSGESSVVKLDDASIKKLASILGESSKK